MSLRFEHAVEIAAPAAVAWRVLTDFARYGEWNPFVIQAAGTLQVGAWLELRVRTGARTRSQRERLCEVVDGVRFAYAMTPSALGALSSLRSHELEVLDARRCRYRSNFRLDGWAAGLVRITQGRALEAGFAAMTQAVRARAETLAA